MRYEKYDIGHKLQFTRDQPHRVFSAAHPGRCQQEVLNDGDGSGEGGDGWDVDDCTAFCHFFLAACPRWQHQHQQEVVAPIPVSTSS